MTARLALAAALLAACSSTPAPAPASDASAALAVTLRTRRPDRDGWGRPQTVHFVRFEGDAGDPSGASPILASNHTRANVAYIANAEPGVYFAVAATEKADGKTWTTYLPLELIRKTATRVEPGQVAYMGTITVHATRTGKHIEPTQQHYMRLIEPDWTRRSVLNTIFGRSRVFLGTDYVYRREDAHAQDKVRKHLAESGWKSD